MQNATVTENPFEIESAAVSDRGLNEARPQNEDSYLDQPERGIFAVADGVGGAQAGEVASQMAIEILSEAFTNITENADPEQVMRAAIEKANEAIFEMSSQFSQLSKMATTIVALHLHGDVATIGHVGDSRLYRFIPDGRIVQETLDHSIVAEEVRAGRMTEQQAAVHPSRNVISRALGAEPSVEIDLKTIMVEPGTSFLLCTDGITRHVSDDEMVGILRSDGQAASACAKLKDLCYKRGAEDNLTAVVVHVGTLDYIGDSSHEIPYLEDDEDTLATARPQIDTTATSKIELSPAAKFDIVEDETEPIEFEPEAEENIATARDGSPVRATDGKVPPPSDIDPAARPVVAVKSTLSEVKPGVSVGNIFLLLLVLLVGAAAGVGGFYYWNLTHPPVVVEAPVINEMKSSDIPLTSFEEARRLVDKDPNKYIAANQNPSEAQDYYLLGRAYLLTGQWFQAKNAFNAAKSKLSDLDERDRQTIANEIEMAMAIINSPSATENFSKSVVNRAPGNSSGLVR
jgi:serine/threonine protein phosphatase PrpC